MKKIYVLFVLLILSVGSSWGQGFLVEFSFDLRGKGFKYDGASTNVEVMASSGAGLDDLGAAVMYAGNQPVDDGDGNTRWQFVLQLESPSETPITQLHILSDIFQLIPNEIDYPYPITYYSDNLIFDQRSLMISSLTGYPCYYNLFKDKILRQFDGSKFDSNIMSSFDVKVIPLTNKRKIYIDNIDYDFSDYTSSDIILTYGNGTVESIKDFHSTQRTFLKCFIDENASGIKKINFRHKGKVKEIVFDPVLMENDTIVSFSGFASSGDTKLEIKYYPKCKIYPNSNNKKISVFDPITLTTKQVHQNQIWKYSLDLQTWYNLPTSFIQGNNGAVKFTGYQLLGEQYKNYLNKDIYFKVQYNNISCSNDKETEILYLTLSLSAPKIASTVATPVSCNGNSDGYITLTLDRDLNAGESVVVDYGVGIPKQVSTLGENRTIKLENLSPGEYTVEISSGGSSGTTISTGEGYTAKVTVTSPTPVTFTLVESANVLCYNGNNGSFKVSASGGTPGYMLYWKKQSEATYQSQPFTSEMSLSNLTAATYEYYVIDSKNCPAKTPDELKKTISITQPASVLNFELISLTEPSGAGLSNGSIIITGDGGTPETNGLYTTTWKNKQSGQILTTVTNEIVNGKFRSTLSAIPSGTYLVDIEDKNGCSLSKEYVLNEPNSMNVTIKQSQSILCNSETTGELIAHAEGGKLNPGENYSFQWFKKDGANYISIGVTDSIADNMGAGIYKIEVKDKSQPANTSIAEFTLNEPALITTTLSSQHISCYDANNGSISIKAEGGTAPYTLYHRKKGEINYQEVSITSSGSTYTMNNLIPGEYQLYLIDNNNCYATIDGKSVASVTISQPEKALEISSAVVNPLSGFGTSDASIVVKISGGTPDAQMPFYNIVWKDENNTVIPAINTLDAFGMFISTIQNLGHGIYSVEVTDKNYANIPGGCFVSRTFTIKEVEPLSVTLENTQGINCYGEQTGILVAHVQGGIPSLNGLPYVYNWYEMIDGVETLLQGKNDSILTGLPVGIYKVKVKDFGTPASDAQSTVYQITQPTLLQTNLTTGNISCYDGNDGFISISVSGGVGNYQLFCKKENEDADYKMHPATTGNDTFKLDNLPAGKYSIYVLDGNNCYAKITGNDVFEIELSQPEKPLAILSTTQLDPSGYGRLDGNIEITIDGGTPESNGSYLVEWKDVSGNILTPVNRNENGQFISLLDNIGTGTYTVDVKDKNYTIAYLNENTSCTVSGIFNLNQPDELTVSIRETRSILCNGDSNGQLVTTAEGGTRNASSGLPYKYQWFKQESDGTYTLITNAKDSVLNNIPSGVYKVEISDYSRTPNNTSEIFDLKQPEVLQATATSTSVTCGQKTTISVDATGGTAPYQYEWTTGDKTQSVFDIGAGKYFVFITDANGCNTTAVATVSTPSDLRVDGIVNHPVCYQVANGSIRLQISGGTAPYSYYWSNGNLTKDLESIKAGNYWVTVTDNDGCSFTQSFVLTDPEKLTVNIGEDRTLCKGQKLILEPEVIDKNTKFSWTGPESFFSSESKVTLSKAGTYQLTITDSKGCQASDEIQISVSDSDISSEMVVASQLFVNDTVIIVNISDPVPERIEWLIEESDSLTVIEMAEHYAKVVFKELGYYTVGLRSHVGDCYMDVVKSLTVTNPDDDIFDEFGESIIEKFIIYPNPNDGIFTAEVELNKVSSIRLRIFNISTGNVLSDKKVSGESFYQIPYNEYLGAGVFIVLLETASGHMHLKMIVR